MDPFVASYLTTRMGKMKRSTNRLGTRHSLLFILTIAVRISLNHQFQIFAAGYSNSFRSNTDAAWNTES